jgi:hypothetical protein
MSNTALFKEAIAEAKAVRDAAMANAKAALEETITPHLQNMLAAKLEEMASEEETTAEEVTEAVEEEVMEEEMPKSVTEEDESEEETPEEESEEEEAPEEEEETPEDESEEESEDEMEIGEMTLPELEELINDIVAQQMQDIEDSSDEIDMTGAEEEGEPAQADIDAEELESETISMEELLAEIEEITEAAKNEEVEEEAVNEIDLNVANAPQIIAATIAAIGAYGFGSMINKEALKKMSLPKLKAFAAKFGVGKENEEDQEETNPQELNEALETIETLKKDISETNLLNAKLLYVNKIFKANNLTESQKVNTITAFDKAETVKEVKLVFETISQGLDKTASSCVNENKGFASKAAGVAPKTITEAVETPDNSWRDRMQVLAGIKKPN